MASQVLIAPDMRPPLRRGGDNVEQLRADIDAGRMGDKVRFADPAVAPLGADDEAAGTPPVPELVALERRRASPDPGPAPADDPRSAIMLQAVIGAAVLLVLGGLMLV